VIAEIRQKVESTQPALEIDFGQVIGDMLGDLMESVQPIEIKIFGTISISCMNFRKGRRRGEKVQGTADVFNGIVISGPR
jgi:hypothetical protein